MTDEMSASIVQERVATEVVAVVTRGPYLQRAEVTNAPPGAMACVERAPAVCKGLFT